MLGYITSGNVLLKEKNGGVLIAMKFVILKRTTNKAGDSATKKRKEGQNIDTIIFPDPIFNLCQLIDTIF